MMSPGSAPIGRAWLHYSQFPQSLALVLSNCSLIAGKVNFSLPLLDSGHINYLAFNTNTEPFTLP